MDSCWRVSCLEPDWQATFPGIVNNLKDKLLSSSNATVRVNELPKPLTTEALYMIFVLISFIVLSVAGSSITAFEHLSGRNTNQNRANGEKQAKKVSVGEKKKRGFEYFDSHGVLKKTKRFLKCFCFFTNGSKNLSYTSSKENELNYVHGIRALSATWAIFIHTSFFYGIAVSNLEDQGPVLRSGLMKAFLKGDYLNDALFTIGGFLNAYNFGQDYLKNRRNVSWFHFYIKRIVRIVPLYMITLGFYTTLFSYLGSGSVWPTYATNPLCKNSWWWNLLFINNFRTAQQQCMVWVWYIATDFQFYILSPLFLVPLYRWPKLGYILSGIFICGSCLLNFLITKNQNLTFDLFRIGFHLSDLKEFYKRGFDYFNNLVEKPYSRVSSYLVGILLAYYLRSREKDVTTKRNSVFLYFGWIITVIFMWICFTSVGKTDESLTNFAVFNGLRHLLFSVGISWIIFVCSTGQAEFLRRCLSWHGFNILARLSYCACLINQIILEYYFLRWTEAKEYSSATMVTIGVGVYFWTFIASFLLSAVIEVPVSRLYSMFTSHQKKE